MDIYGQIRHEKWIYEFLKYLYERVIFYLLKEKFATENKIYILLHARVEFFLNFNNIETKKEDGRKRFCYYIVIRKCTYLSSLKIPICHHRKIIILDPKSDIKTSNYIISISYEQMQIIVFLINTLWSLQLDILLKLKRTVSTLITTLF